MSNINWCQQLLNVQNKAFPQKLLARFLFIVQILWFTMESTICICNSTCVWSISGWLFTEKLLQDFYEEYPAAEFPENFRIIRFFTENTRQQSFRRISVNIQRFRKNTENRRLFKLRKLRNITEMLWKLGCRVFSVKFYGFLKQCMLCSFINMQTAHPHKILIFVCRNDISLDMIMMPSNTFVRILIYSYFCLFYFCGTMSFLLHLQRTFAECVTENPPLLYTSSKQTKIRIN